MARARRGDVIRRATLLARRVNPNLDPQFFARLFGEGEALVESGAPGPARGQVMGAYARQSGFIAVALNASDPEIMGVTAHEAWHSIEDMLSLSDRHTLYRAFGQRDMTRSPRENVAYAFQDWVQRRESRSAAGRIFQKIYDFFRKLGQILRVMGYRTPEDVFRDVLGGRMAEPASTMAQPAAGPAFAIDRAGRITTPDWFKAWLGFEGRDIKVNLDGLFRKYQRMAERGETLAPRFTFKEELQRHIEETVAQAHIAIEATNDEAYLVARIDGQPRIVVIQDKGRDGMVISAFLAGEGQLAAKIQGILDVTRRRGGTPAVLLSPAATSEEIRSLVSRHLRISHDMAQPGAYDISTGAYLGNLTLKQVASGDARQADVSGREDETAPLRERAGPGSEEADTDIDPPGSGTSDPGDISYARTLGTSGSSPNRSVWQQAAAWAGTYLNSVRVDDARARLQDRFIYLRRAQEALADGDVDAVGKALNAYRAEELMHGKTKERLDRSERDHLRPLVSDIQARGLSLA